MPELTRRPHPERSDTWHVFFGDVQVGTIVGLAGQGKAMEMGRRLLIEETDPAQIALEL